MSASRVRHRLGTARRRPWRLGTLALLAALAALSACERAPLAPAAVPQAAAPVASNARVTGRVAAYGAHGFEPVSGARITARDGASATSDAEGRFVLQGLAAGPQTLTIHHPEHAPTERAVIVMPGVGVPNANVLLSPRTYGVRQAAAFEAVVTGVVFDPRGAALAGADVTLDCPRAHGGAGTRLITRTNADGFFAATLANLAPGATAPTVTYGAAGTSPGGVPLSTEADATAELDGPRLALNIQALKFPDVAPQAIVGSAFVLPGAEGRLSGSLSARADEFYLQLVSGDQRVDALPVAVENGEASFRMPAGLPETAVRAVIVPFGRLARASEPSPPFITSYTTADLDRDVTFEVESTLTDLTGLPDTVNDTRFLSGDRARYQLTLSNANPLVPQDLELTGKVPVGTEIEAVTVAGAPVAFEGPDLAGAWRVGGLQMPLAGTLAFEMTLKSVARLPNATPFAVTGLSLRMPSLELTRTVPPADSPALLAGSIDTAAFAIAKEVRDDGTPGNGVGHVVLTLTPVNSLAGAAFRITDRTRTEQASSATAAAFLGTTVLPPPGVPMGLTTSDHLDLRIDALGRVVQIFGPNYDAETLIGQINTTVGIGGLVAASRTVDGRFYLERIQQGHGKTLEILGSSSANMLSLLGLTPGFQGSGYRADLNGAGVSATQPGGTRWAVVTISNTWSGSLNVSSFMLVPPAAYQPGDGPDTPITVLYPIRKLNLKPGTAGGGVGNNYGTQLQTFNLIYTDDTPALFQLLNRTGPDAPAASDL